MALTKGPDRNSGWVSSTVVMGFKSHALSAPSHTVLHLINAALSPPYRDYRGG